MIDPAAPSALPVIRCAGSRRWARLKELGQLLAAVPLGIWTVGQSLVYAVAPWLRYDAYGVPPLADTAWARFVGVVPGRAFPLFGTDGATAGLALAYGAALLALVAIGWRTACHERVTQEDDHRTA